MSGSESTMRERFARRASSLLDEEPRLAIVLADISTSLFAAAAEQHPARVINVGIREQLLVGVAAGMALAGLRPLAHTYAPFLVERAFEQIKLDLGHQGLGAVLVSVGASYDASTSGRTHHAPGDVALLSTIPDVTIHVPGHADEAERLLLDAVAATGIAYLRLSDQSNREPMPIEPGRFHVMRRGSDAVVVAVGPALDRVVAATADQDVTVLYAATVRPFDATTLRGELRGPDVVLVEPYLAGTSSGEIADALADVPHRLLAIGTRPVDLRRYGTPEEHERAHGLDVEGIRDRIAAFLAARPTVTLSDRERDPSTR